MQDDHDALNRMPGVLGSLLNPPVTCSITDDRILKVRPASSGKERVILLPQSRVSHYRRITYNDGLAILLLKVA